MLEENDYPITLKAPKSVVERIDFIRKSSRIPRTAWVYQAIIEKLEKDEQYLKEK